MPLATNCQTAQPSNPSASSQTTQRGKKRRSISTASADRIGLLILLPLAFMWPLIYLLPPLWGALCAFSALAWMIAGASLLAVLGAL